MQYRNIVKSEEIGATNTNTWHIPVNDQGDAFGPLNDYFENPLKTQDQLPAFITFPSIKDQNFNKFLTRYHVKCY